MSYTADHLEGLAPQLADYYTTLREFIKDSIARYYPETLTMEVMEDGTGLPSLFDHDLLGLHQTLYTPTREYLSRGGKMLRPILAAMTLSAYGKNPFEYGEFLAAIEAMEDSSIIMDDYIDNSERRRGGPCAHVVHGFPLANISSCTLFAMAHAVFYRNHLGLDQQTLHALLNAVSEEWLQMAYGQIEEFFWTEDNINDVTVSQYFQETIARCAFLTFRGPLRYAAIVAGAPSADLPRLARIGESLLVGYHIRGDNLDLQPDSAAWGKVAGEDITIGRRTLLINEVLQNASGEDRKLLESILNERTEDEAKKRIVYEMILKYDVMKKADALAQQFNVRTKQEMNMLSISETHHQLFYEFADYCMMTRKI